LRPQLHRPGHPRQDAARDDLVHHAVVTGLLGTEDEVALGVRVDPLDRLAGVLGHDLLHATTLAGDLGGVDLDVGRLPLDAAVGWWRSTREFGSAYRFPPDPAARITAAAEAA